MSPIFTPASPKHKNLFMFKNYFKIAARHLVKQKMYSAIKIGGFALSTGFLRPVRCTVPADYLS
jgi:hypothetical protein